MNNTQIEQPWRDYLVLVARTYAAANGLALATVSRRFHGTDSFFNDFANGTRTVTLRKLEQMLLAFQDEWPETTTWPRPPKRLARQIGETVTEK